MLKVLKPLLAAAATIIVIFVAMSLFDVLVYVIYTRFYNSVVFIVTFGVGGILAAAFSYAYGTEQIKGKDEKLRWTLLLFIVTAGLVFFFPLARLEAGEYASAFKAFGATLALGSLLFIDTRVK